MVPELRAALGPYFPDEDARKQLQAQTDGDDQVMPFIGATFHEYMRGITMKNISIILLLLIFMVISAFILIWETIGSTADFIFGNPFTRMSNRDRLIINILGYSVFGLSLLILYAMRIMHLENRPGFTIEVHMEHGQIFKKQPHHEKHFIDAVQGALQINVAQGIDEAGWNLHETLPESLRSSLGSSSSEEPDVIVMLRAFTRNQAVVEAALAYFRQELHETMADLWPSILTELPDEQQ